MSVSDSVNPSVMCTHVYAQILVCVPVHVHTGILCVYIERRWMHAGVHIHVCMHGLSQEPGPFSL